MNKKTLSERDISTKFISPAIENAGWNKLTQYLDKIRYVTPPKNQERNRTRLIENDILVSITAEVGNLGLIPANFGEAYINQHTALVRLNNLIATHFICYLFLSKELKDQLNVPRCGMKNSFRLSDIENLLFALPLYPTKIKPLQS